MAKTRKTYKGENGIEYPLVEATWDLFIKVLRRHCKHAIMGSTSHCVIAEAIKEHDCNIIEVCITAGRDAWVIMTSDEYPDGAAIHFVLNTSPQRVRDKFDTDKQIKTQVVELRRPTKSRTIAARDASNRRRRQELIHGTGKPYKPRANPIKTGGAIRFTAAPAQERPHVEISPDRVVGKAMRDRSPTPRTRVSTYDNTTLIQMRPRARISRGGVEVPTGAE